MKKMTRSAMNAVRKEHAKNLQADQIHAANLRVVEQRESSRSALKESAKANRGKQNESAISIRTYAMTPSERKLISEYESVIDSLIKRIDWDSYWEYKRVITEIRAMNRVIAKKPTITRVRFVKNEAGEQLFVHDLVTRHEIDLSDEESLPRQPAKPALVNVHYTSERERVYQPAKRWTADGPFTLDSPKGEWRSIERLDWQYQDVLFKDLMSSKAETRRWIEYRSKYAQWLERVLDLGITMADVKRLRRTWTHALDHESVKEAVHVERGYRRTFPVSEMPEPGLRNQPSKPNPEQVKLWTLKGQRRLGHRLTLPLTGAPLALFIDFLAYGAYARTEWVILRAKERNLTSARRIIRGLPAYKAGTLGTTHSVEKVVQATCPEALYEPYGLAVGDIVVEKSSMTAYECTLSGWEIL